VTGRRLTVTLSASCSEMNKAAAENLHMKQNETPNCEDENIIPRENR